jgi:1,2-diacylglycerol 3-beta-glucosyltransferase
MVLVSLLLALVTLPLLLPTLADLVALARGWPRSRRPVAPLSYDPPRLLFLVPAHDEELLIGACIRSLRALRYPADRAAIVVIADNCTDGTARIAHDEGVACFERTDLDQPGKPHAIAWALGRLPWEEYDSVVIVDADSEVDPDFGVALARVAPLRDKAAQGYHKVLNPDESALTRLGAILSAASHRFAYPVKQRADLNTPLLGNGMCIGTDILARYGWRAFTICEDWEMYAALTSEGVRIDGVPDAVVASQEARTLAQSASQRRRWTAGKLTVLARFIGPLLRSRAIGPAQKLDAVAELAAPGAALHLGLVVLLAGGALLLRPPGALFFAGLLVASLVRPAIYATAALRQEHDPGSALKAFLFLPAYTFWRVVVAIASLRMLGDRPWIRTARHRTP